MEMTKVLKSHTTVPDSLYVRRKADALLAEIIADMGRPGYVLVSRQMGKTNLLLHAKRTLPKRDDAFIYVDLTNSFKDARDCFRHIIDTALDSYRESFGYLVDEIESERAISKRLDHAEHIHELRKLLRVIKGKMVIILDEVDALANSSYSDTVFKQIRSVYFTRANYPELERLTYVISGVAEPTTLIKDPSISPFNIGQNIFLNDFSVEEYEEFLRISSLNLDKEVKDQVYYWSSGNPRITYDICSELESIILANRELNALVVDELVREMYFSSLDRAPIDHIRDLIYTDKELRKAVIVLKTQQENDFSKALRKKLYLSGILGSDFDFPQAKIKNLVIDNAFPISFLNEIERKVQYDFETIRLLFVAENYLEITLIPSQEVSILVGGEEGTLIESLLIISYFKTYFYNLITDHFELFGAQIKEEERGVGNLLRIKLESLYYCGISYLHLGHADKAIPFFQAVIAEGLKDQFYYLSRSNMGSAMLQIEDYEPKQIIQTLLAAIEELRIDRPQIKTSNIQKIRNFTYYLIAQAQIDSNEFESARTSLNTSLRSAEVASKPAILYALASIASEGEEVDKLLGEAAQIIVENQFKPDDYNIDDVLGINYELLLEILKLWVANGVKDDAEELVNYILGFELNSELEEDSIDVRNLSQNDVNSAERTAQFSLYRLMLLNFQRLITPVQAGLMLSSVTDKPLETLKIAKSVPLVLAVANSNIITSLSPFEASKVVAHLIYLFSRRQNNESLQLVKFLKKAYLNGDNVSLMDKIFIKYYEFDAVKNVNPIIAFRIANDILVSIGNIKADDKTPAMISMDTIDIIKRSTFKDYNTLNPYLGSKITSAKRKELVTVIYRDTTIKKGRLKVFESDILNGNCVLL